jgi:anti-sigma B factor antagonist
MGEALTVRVRHERGYAVVAVAGEVDIATVTRLRERLFGLAVAGRPLVVDLDQVSFIDAAGLGALAGAAGRAAAHGASLHVVCARPQTVRVFRLTGLDRQIPLARSLDEALEALAAARDTPALAVPPAGRPKRPGPQQAACSDARTRPGLGPFHNLGSGTVSLRGRPDPGTTGRPVRKSSRKTCSIVAVES